MAAGTFTDTVRFYPLGNPLPKLVDDADDFRFTINLHTVQPARPDIFERNFGAQPEALVFERTLPWISEEQLGSRRITIPIQEKAAPAAPAK